MELSAVSFGKSGELSLLLALGGPVRYTVAMKQLPAIVFVLMFPTLFFCQDSGRRTATPAEAKFANVYTIDQGIIGWALDGFPVRYGA